MNDLFSWHFPLKRKATKEEVTAAGSAKALQQQMVADFLAGKAADFLDGRPRAIEVKCSKPSLNSETEVLSLWIDVYVVMADPSNCDIGDVVLAPGLRLAEVPVEGGKEGEKKQLDYAIFGARRFEPSTYGWRRIA